MSAIVAEEIEHLTGRLDGIIREQAGDVVFEHLDRVRRLAAAARQHHDPGSFRTQRALIHRLSVSEAYQITHALSLFFQVVNLCEERGRIRHLLAD